MISCTDKLPADKVGAAKLMHCSGRTGCEEDDGEGEEDDGEGVEDEKGEEEQMY